MKEKKERKNFYHWHWGWIDPYWFSVMVGRWFGLTRIVLSRDFFYFFPTFKGRDDMVARFGRRRHAIIHHRPPTHGTRKKGE